METRIQSPLEAKAAGIAAFFDKESKKIAGKIKKAEKLNTGVNIGGSSVIRGEQRTLHLEHRQTELEDARSIVLEVITKTPKASQGSSIHNYFSSRVAEIDLETERIDKKQDMFKEGGVRKSKRQEREQLNTLRTDMFRVGNHVLSVIGGPPLIDTRNSAGKSQPPQLTPVEGI